ncbi:cytochrome P450 2A4-like isoform X3 [Ascaphus truei]|uniref:cytochrome P450 2A4-like isoform X3 n=1 Tax=Ascaphus truei TaxID=8439 RepID=UPI003F5A76CD
MDMELELPNTVQVLPSLDTTVGYIKEDSLITKDRDKGSPARVCRSQLIIMLPASAAHIILLLVIFGLLTWWKRTRKGQSELPPGPAPLPLLGNILQVNPKTFLQSLNKLRKEYGPVFTVYFGSRPVVMLCGYEVVKEALVDHRDAFSARGKIPVAEHILKGFGITAGNGERSKQLRRFSLLTLRDFGMGKRSIEERIQEEAKCLVEEFHKTQGMPFDPTFLLACAVSNVICSIVFGQRFDYKDERFLSLLNNINKILLFMNSTLGLVFFNFHKLLRHIPGPHHREMKHLSDLKDFVQEKVRVSQETLNPCSPENYIECFLIKMQKEHQNPNTEFHLQNLVASTINLFFAGTETVNTTLRYGFLILIRYQEIQGMVQKEIDSVIGRKRLPTVEDRSRMPYTDAVIHEIQRFSDIIPTGLPHSATRAISFRGYLIPKGTDVYPLLTTVLQDPNEFTNPAEFNPGRFLDEFGCIRKSEAFMPFSAVFCRYYRFNEIIPKRKFGKRQEKYTDKGQKGTKNNDQ